MSGEGEPLENYENKVDTQHKVDEAQQVTLKDGEIETEIEETVEENNTEECTVENVHDLACPPHENAQEITITNNLDIIQDENVTEEIEGELNMYKNAKNAEEQITVEANAEENGNVHSNEDTDDLEKDSIGKNDTSDIVGENFKNETEEGSVSEDIKVETEMQREELSSTENTGQNAYEEESNLNEIEITDDGQNEVRKKDEDKSRVWIRRKGFTKNRFLSKASLVVEMELIRNTTLVGTIKTVENYKKSRSSPSVVCFHITKLPITDKKQIMITTEWKGCSPSMMLPFKLADVTKSDAVRIQLHGRIKSLLKTSEVCLGECVFTMENVTEAPAFYEARFLPQAKTLFSSDFDS